MNFFILRANFLWRKMMVDKIKNLNSITDQFLLIGIGLSILIWVFESFIHVFVFGDGTFIAQALRPGLHEIWMRFLISSLFILFGLYAQFIIKRRKQIEKTLRESESQLLEAQSVAHIGNWSWDLQTNKLIWSKENYRIFCLPP